MISVIWECKGRNIFYSEKELRTILFISGKEEVDGYTFRHFQHQQNP